MSQTRARSVTDNATERSGLRVYPSKAGTGLAAAVVPVADGVRVTFFTDHKAVGSEVIDAPFHHVVDHVYATLCATARGQPLA